MALKHLKDHLSHRRSSVRVAANYWVYLGRILSLAALLVVFLIGYWVGIHDYLKLGAIDAFEFRALSEDYRATLGLKSKLEEENLHLNVNSQINVKAQEALRVQLIDMQVEIKRLNDELLFYRHLHESDKLVEGLRVQSFELRPISNAKGRYRYSSIVSFFSSNARNSFFEGFYDIFVEVRANDADEGSDADKSIKRIKVTTTNRNKRKYKFKLIHTIKGEFKLDEDVEPIRLFFSLQPRSKSVDAVEKIYSFEQLIDPNRQY